MSRIFFFLIAAALAYAAGDPWAKVKDLKTGTELRVYKVNAKQPILAKMDELTDESLVVVLKNEQMAIPKDQIDRIDYRPPAKGPRITKETKTTMDIPNQQPVGPGPTPAGPPLPGTSSSSGLSVGSKPDFETIYRRTPALPAPK